MSDKTKITITQNGPAIVQGSLEITHIDGTTEKKEKAAICRCGASKNKPFCDGSHKEAGFEG